MANDKGKQADPAKLGAAINRTSMKGKTAEQWADQVWDKAKGGNR